MLLLWLISLASSVSISTAATSLQVSSTIGKKYEESKAHNTFNNVKLTTSTFTAKNETLYILPQTYDSYVKHIFRKSNKKYPKRTIQKIVKKAKKNKSKAMYTIEVTSPETEPTPFEKVEPTTTTEVVQKKKARKWSSKVLRYPLPFHRLDARRDLNIYHKIKREAIFDKL